MKLDGRWLEGDGQLAPYPTAHPNPAVGSLLTKQTTIIRETCLGYQESPSFNYPLSALPLQKIVATP